MINRLQELHGAGQAVWLDFIERSFLESDAPICSDTINTIPPATMNAFQSDGAVSHTLVANVEAGDQVLAEAARMGLDLPAVTASLARHGVAIFKDAAEICDPSLPTRSRYLTKV